MHKSLNPRDHVNKLDVKSKKWRRGLINIEICVDSSIDELDYTRIILTTKFPIKWTDNESWKQYSIDGKTDILEG